jgi:5-methylcytosine-specific restriction enzyme subunit McrC
VIEVKLAEWQRATPTDTAALRDLRLAEHPAMRAVVDLGALDVRDTSAGATLEASSFVGTVGVGHVRISIVPKIRGAPLLGLLRYAYGLRNLRLFPNTEQTIANGSFQDLFVAQLVEEADDLLRRGLRREYMRVDAELESPRGRIDFQRIARTRTETRVGLACQYHPRIDDCLINQLLLAGLREARSLTSDRGLRERLARSAAVMDESVSTARLDRHLLERSRREQNRLTAAYRPAVEIIELLYAGSGVVQEGSERRAEFRGFLFDMNRFFQALIGRFLRDNLQGYQVKDEHALRDIFSYVQGHNPKHRRHPKPRPDFVVFGEGGPQALLDAKYRDLWEQNLPREMLYQLAIYALSAESSGKASIIYPTLADDAREQRLDLRDPVNSARRGEIVLRPVNLNYLHSLLEAPKNSANVSRREAEARRVVFGS